MKTQSVPGHATSKTAAKAEFSNLAHKRLRLDADRPACQEGERQMILPVVNNLNSAWRDGALSRR